MEVQSLPLVCTLALNAAAHLELKSVVIRPGAIRNIARVTADETNAETGTSTAAYTRCDSRSAGPADAADVLGDDLVLRGAQPLMGRPS